MRLGLFIHSFARRTITMEIDEIRELLNGCTRTELRDHAFGDAEVTWWKDEKQVADGYFGRNLSRITFENNLAGSIEGTTAQEFRYCGVEGHIERNDSTGPDTFVEGRKMPGLGFEGVRKDLTATPTESGD